MCLGQPYARIDLNLMPESTLSPSKRLWIWPQCIIIGTPQKPEHEPEFYTFMESRNRFQGIDYASLCSLAGRYDNPLPTRFIAHIECSKIPALSTAISSVHRGRILRKTWCMEPYTRDDLNLMPLSTLSPIQGLWIWPPPQYILIATPQKPEPAFVNV